MVYPIELFVPDVVPELRMVPSEEFEIILFKDAIHLNELPVEVASSESFSVSAYMYVPYAVPPVIGAPEICGVAVGA